MTRLRGRAPKGQRLHASAPQGHWRTTTILGALRLDGSTVCMTVEGATDTEVFRAYIREVLRPTLRSGDVLVMDNLSPHKSEPTLALLAEAGVEVCFLPAYSPDFNPIEKLWSKVKAYLRRVEARTAAELFAAIGQALKQVTAQDARNWFAACGQGVVIFQYGHPF